MESTGIILTAAGLTFANEWYHTDKPNWRIVFAAGGAALFLRGVDMLSPQLGTGLAVMGLITALTVPVDGESPADTVIQILGLKTPTKTTTKLPAGSVPAGGGGRDLVQ